jgi:DNA gyrase subunit A
MIPQMTVERPDLSQIDPAIRAYVESLEAEIERLRSDSDSPDESAAPPEPSEPPTTLNLITLNASGLAKRTPRHLYGRQRRGGMGIFDLETPDDDPPINLAIADESATAILLTNHARAFRFPPGKLPDSEVRVRGQSITADLKLNPGERIAVILPDVGRGYVALLSQSGFVRCVPGHLFGETLSPGTEMYNLERLGPLAAACWTPGSSDLFIATGAGLGTRFSEKQVSLQGGPGIRLESGDSAVAVASVKEDSGLFLLGADGKGTIRLMSGFSPNKSPGAGGKVAMKTDRLVSAVAVNQEDDLFIISRLSKMIRFRVNEVPAKEGVVQGVHCMALRADETVAVTVSR